jgi:hypothetical protein
MSKTKQKTLSVSLKAHFEQDSRHYNSKGDECKMKVGRRITFVAFQLQYNGLRQGLLSEVSLG